MTLPKISLHAVILGCCLAGLAHAGGLKPAAMVLKPKREQKVGQEVEVVGKLLIAGKPVVLVRSDKTGSPWRVQKGVRMISRSTFRVTASLPVHEKPPKGRYRLMIAVPQNAQQAEWFPSGKALSELPLPVAYSVETPLVLVDNDKPGKPTAPAIPAPAPKLASDTIAYPTAKQPVERVEELTAQVSANHFAVLVRSDERNSPWWVQETGVGGLVTATVRFGNDKTPAGARFFILVVKVKTPEALQAYPVGTPIKKLPEGAEALKELEVVRR